MKRTIVVTVLLVAITTISAIAQAKQPESDVTTEVMHNKIKELLILTETQKMAEQVIDQLFTAYETMIPDVPKEVWASLKKEMRISDFIETVYPIYAKYYSFDDINGLILFYKSPLGQKVLKNQGPLMQETIAAGMAWGQKAGQDISAKLKEKGFKLPESLK
jgi:hypothetical protein